MSAHRVCACGAELVVTGDTLFCFGCGARVRTWRVLLDGRAVAMGALPWAGGVGAKSAVAFAPEFEAGLLGLCAAPAEPLRYAVQSSRRGGHRRAS